MTIPKKIWFLWYQGLSEAPLVVKKCYESWQKYNPDWEVIFLEENNLTDYITPSLSPEKLCQLSKNHQSDLLRLELLEKYGGVWVDSTTICRIPLDKWLEDYTQAGFFTFIHNTRGYGWIVSWFLAAEKSNPIISKMTQKFSSFYENNEFYHSGEIAHKRIKFLELFLNRKYKTTRFWSSWLVSKVFKVYPYFIFHFIFASLIGSDRELLRLYKTMKPYYNTGDMLGGSYGLLRPLTAEIKERIDSKIDPVYKLTWKYKQEDYSSLSILYYLLEEDA
jgi:Capsular polysaccharide synthesis protein